MDYQHTDNHITHQTLTWFDRQLQAIENRLEPTMTGLSPSERETCHNTGWQSATPARNALELAQSFESAFEHNVDIEAFASDMDRHERALWMLQRIMPFVQKLEDTVTATRFQLFMHTHDVMTCAQQSHDPALEQAAVTLEQSLSPARSRR